MALTVVEVFWVLREEQVYRMQATHRELLWWVCMARAEGNCVSSRTSVWQHFLQQSITETELYQKKRLEVKFQADILPVTQSHPGMSD